MAKKLFCPECSNTHIRHNQLVMDKEGVSPKGYYLYTCADCGYQFNGNYSVQYPAPNNQQEEIRMDASKLATKMLEWEVQQSQASALAAEIEAAVLKLGKTQTVGNVRATYSKGRKKFDYEMPGQVADMDIITIHTKTVAITDWKAVCKAIDIQPELVSQGQPSVKVKLI